MEKLKVLIAEDHAMVRDGLKRLLESEADLVVAGQATCGDEVLGELTQGGPFQLLLLDMTMPAPNGPELIRLIRERFLELPILVVTMHNEPRLAQAALRAGANGYITKDAEPTLLLEAVRKVLNGGRYVSQQVLEAIAFLPTQANHQRLSAREHEILLRLAAGQSNAEIAHELFISEKTVSTHKANLMTKLGAKNLAELVRLADSLSAAPSSESASKRQV
jgi:DNA-binding NarL/FixJ family response regulator